MMKRNSLNGKALMIYRIYQVKKRTLSFLLAFILAAISMLSGVGPFEKMLSEVFAAANASTTPVYGYTYSYDEATYGGDGPIMGGGEVPGTAWFDYIDVCTSGHHPEYAASGTYNGNNWSYSQREFFWNNYIGNAGNRTMWAAPNMSRTTTKKYDNDRTALFTYEARIPYGHSYRFYHEKSNYLYSEIVPDWKDGAYVHESYWEILKAGEGCFRKVPSVGDSIAVHRFYENETPYVLKFDAYPSKSDAENNINKKGTAARLYESGLEFSGEGKYEIFKEFDFEMDSYRVAKVTYSTMTTYGETRPCYVVNIYPANAAGSGSSDLNDLKIDISGTPIKTKPPIKPENTITLSGEDTVLNIRYYSISANRIDDEDKCYRVDQAFAGLAYQFLSRLMVDGVMHDVDTWEVMQAPTEDDPILYLKVKDECVEHNGTHTLKYTIIDDTYHESSCKKEHCHYLGTREKHSYSAWITDSDDGTHVTQHRSCACGKTENREYDKTAVAEGEVSLGDILTGIDNGNKVPIIAGNTIMIGEDAVTKIKEYNPGPNLVLLFFTDEEDLNERYVKLVNEAKNSHNPAVGTRGDHYESGELVKDLFLIQSRALHESGGSDYWDNYIKVTAGNTMPVGASFENYLAYKDGNEYEPIRTYYNEVKDKTWAVVKYVIVSDNSWGDAYLLICPVDDASGSGAQEEVEPHEHHLVTTVSENDPTKHWTHCLKDDAAAQEDPSCCDYDEAASVEAHEYGVYIQGENGKHYRECIVCGYKDEESHSFSDSYSYAGGNKHVKECTVCGALSDKEACSYGQETVVTASHKTAGSKSKTCDICGHTETEYTSPAIAHTWDSEWSKDSTCHWHKCTGEDCVNDSDIFDKKIEHAYEEQVTLVATCTTAGTKSQVCKTCGYINSNVTIDPLGHDFSDEWASDENNHWHVCRRAGDDVNHEKGNNAAHSFVTKNDGSGHWQECSVCGYNENASATGKTAHNVNPDEAWVSGNNVSHYHTCTVCGGNADEEAHTYGEWIVTKEATETEEGSRWRSCTVCGHIEEEAIAKIKNNEEDKKDPNTPVPPPSNTITAETKNVVLVTKNAYSITGGMTPVSTGKKGGNPYTVGNKKILSIDKNGKIKVKKAGTTTITFTTADGVTHTVTVTVEKPKKQNRTITDPNKTVIDAGDLLKGARYSVPDTVTSTKTGVATIGADGKIHIAGKGTTKIKYTFGKLKVKATLKVKVESNKASDNGNDGKSAGETAAVEDNIRVDPGIGEEISHIPEECVEIINDAMEIYPVEVTDETADEAADEATCE